MIQKKLIAMAGVIAMAAMIQTAQAAFTDTLADLVNPSGNFNSLTIGDKTFSGFSYLATDLTSFNANNIQVTASIGSDGTYFLTFGGSIALSSSGPAVADLLLGYTVTANPGKIFMIDQQYTGSAQPLGGSFIAVDENAYVGGVSVANSHLQVGDLSDPFAETGDNLMVNPSQSTLQIVKDIGLGVSSATGGFVTISEVSQSFHQVPEPTTVIAGALLLLPFGASTLRILRKNRTA